MRIALLFSLFLIIFSCENPEKPTDATVISHESSGKQGIVAAGKPASVQAGLDLLQNGGNAVDAAVAVILVETITEFGDFCIGGEAAFMVYDAKSQQVKVISGQGPAPRSKEAIDWYYLNGIPANDIKAAPVPGIPGLCVAALQQFGTTSFEEAAQGMLKLLQSEEKDWYANLSSTIRKLIEAEKKSPGNRIQKLQAVHDRFYRGDIADSLAAWYKATGAWLTKKDLEAFHPVVEDPVVGNYRGYDIYKCQTWTQGPTLLQALNLLENFDVQAMDPLSTDYIHVVTESFKLAFADRDRYYGDPAFSGVPLYQLLSEAYTRERLGLIDMDKASMEARPGDPVNFTPILTAKAHFKPGQRGTTTCSIIDKEGNVVVATPSGWGSNAGAGGGTGITHSTRLLSFNTQKGHPNSIEARKRPRITLTPTLVMKEGKPILAISVEGGDVQEQTTLNLLVNILEFGMTPLEAVSAPRFYSNLLEDSFNPASERNEAINHPVTLQVNEGIDSLTISRLKERGHQIEITQDAIGSPVVILLDHQTGILKAASDPKIEHYTGEVR